MQQCQLSQRVKAGGCQGLTVLPAERTGSQDWDASLNTHFTLSFLYMLVS